MIPTRKRRYVEREYTVAEIKSLLKIPNDELVIELKYDNDRKRIVLETLLDFDKESGDI